MVNCFIVRPFGTKKYRSKSGIEKSIDFEKVHSELIAPALQKAGFQGNTTAIIAEAGNIREDMFGQLALADIVIADISIHNANVFYELGIRHALRDTGTYLIRCDGQDVPFDLKTDRYLAYDADGLNESVDSLAEGIKATAEAKRRDSPVYGLLPRLEPPEIAVLSPVPSDFLKELKLACEKGRIAHLALLREEASSTPWAEEGLRQIGLATFELKQWEICRLCWEQVRQRNENSVEASLKLATVYQRLNMHPESRLAVDEAIDNPKASASDLAEAYSLKGSNEKSQLLGILAELEPTQWAEVTLKSVNLAQAGQAYKMAFDYDLNSFYAGVNALAMKQIQMDLGGRYPNTWNCLFEDDEEAERQMTKLADEITGLIASVRYSVEAAALRIRSGTGSRDRWLELTVADVALLSGQSGQRVAGLYRKALSEAPSLHFDAAVRQLLLFQTLGLFDDEGSIVLQELQTLNLQATNSAIAKHQMGPSNTVSVERSDAGIPANPEKVILFAGHRIDEVDRTDARFPPSMASKASELIKAELLAALGDSNPEDCLAIAGGANGGDILFHEACAELKLPARLMLAIPSEPYIVESVRHSQEPEWINRFHQVASGAQVEVLMNDRALPAWLKGRENYDVWERNNRWCLNNALSYQAKKLRVILLWDGKQGDGDGGTQHMYSVANDAGVPVYVIDSVTAFSLS